MQFIESLHLDARDDAFKRLVEAMRDLPNYPKRNFGSSF
jgi:hypothetical protein